MERMIAVACPALDLDRSVDREAMVREHLPKLLKLCTLILGNPQEAEDAVQDVFLKAFKSIHRFRGEAGLATWLHRIAINTCKDRLRKQNRRKEQSDDESPAVADPRPDPMERTYAKQMADVALSALSPKEQIAVRLRFGGDYRIDEIAQALSCSPSSVKTHLRRAMKKMAEALEVKKP